MLTYLNRVKRNFSFYVIGTQCIYGNILKIICTMAVLPAKWETSESVLNFTGLAKSLSHVAQKMRVSTLDIKFMFHASTITFLWKMYGIIFIKVVLWTWVALSTDALPYKGNRCVRVPRPVHTVTKIFWLSNIQTFGTKNYHSFYVTSFISVAWRCRIVYRKSRAFSRKDYRSRSW